MNGFRRPFYIRVWHTHLWHAAGCFSAPSTDGRHDVTVSGFASAGEAACAIGTMMGGMLILLPLASYDDEVRAHSPYSCEVAGSDC